REFEAYSRLGCRPLQIYLPSWHTSVRVDGSISQHLYFLAFKMIEARNHGERYRIRLAVP
ncbi:MAG: hypothetical protein GY813_15880, partial [Halieaceae bacterium]|nr:hypothetical protein [Halieaceae bacterium]